MKYGFIGCGNMGGAIARALSKTTNDIMVTDRSGKARQLAEELGCEYTDPITIASSCERIFLAVKPQMMRQALSPLRKYLREYKPLLITMAAGLEISTIQDLAGAELPVIRIMPNTPVAVGLGMILYTAKDVTDEAEKEFLRVFEKAGLFDKIPEDKIDAGSALSGCGPAFVYAFAEALADGGVECGVPRDKAAIYAAQTLLGAAQMLLEYGHPADLKDAVCSPGGTTIAGVHALENAGFRGATMSAITAAYQRTLELKK